MPRNRELVCIHIEQGKIDQQQPYRLPIEDYRANTIVGVHTLDNGETGFFEELLKVKINNQDISIALPNEISLAMSNAWRAYTAASALRTDILNQLKISRTIFGNSVKPFYDYLELIQTAIVFNYKAVEAFCNAVTPDGFVHEKRDGRGVRQVFDKASIERWLKTSEKITDVVPQVLNCPSPKNEKFWPSFTGLERLRNEIIHSKSLTSTEVLAELFSPEVDKFLQSAVDLLKFFHKHKPGHPVFPLEFGMAKVQIVSVPNFDSYLEDVSDRN